MSTFDESELSAIAEFYAVDLQEDMSNEEIVAELEANGVTPEMWASLKAEAEKALADEAQAQKRKPGRPAKKAAAPKPTKQDVQTGAFVVVKMNRLNPTYETHGHRFTKDHPYVAMSAEDAQDIFDTEEGFALANPREVQEYYG